MILAVADALCAAVAVAFTTGIDVTAAQQSLTVGHMLRLAIPVLLLPLAFGLFGLYGERAGIGAIMRRGLIPLLACLALVGLYVAAVPARGWDLLAAGRFLAVLVPAVLLVRAVHGWLSAGGRVAPPAIVLGSSDQARELVELVRRCPRPEFRLVGLIHSRRRVELPADSTAGLPLLGTIDSLEAAVASTSARTILLGMSASRLDAEMLRRLRRLRFQGVAILDLVSVHERLTREIPLEEVDDTWLFGASMSCSRFHVRWLKRVMDLAVCVLLAVPAALVYLPAALAIKLTSPGPILFRQERLGLCGRTFWLLKLRTMRADAEKLTGAVWSGENDPRITRVGRVLRKFRLDELPQLVNVLRGDMSLVGPRPERPVLARKICEQVPLFPERLLVRPGITGWAQVMAPYAASIEDSHRKLRFDLYYIKNLSFWLDLFILAKTASTVLFGREREQGGIVAGRQLEQAAAAPRETVASPELLVVAEPSDEFPMPVAVGPSGAYPISRSA